MTVTVLTAEEAGLPAFDINPTESADVCYCPAMNARAASSSGFRLTTPDTMSSLSAKTEVAG